MGAFVDYQKSIELAIHWKQQGNEEYKNGKYSQAILSYTKMQSLSPIDDGSLLFITSLSNRSAALMKQNRHKDALLDIWTCIRHNNSINTMSSSMLIKLLYRRIQLLELLLYEESCIKQAVLDLQYFSSKYQQNDLEITNTFSKYNIVLPLQFEPFNIHDQEKSIFSVSQEQEQEQDSNICIYRESPLVAWKANDLPLIEYCSFCFTKQTALRFPCESCSLEIYCSIDCKSFASKLYHKDECKTLNHLNGIKDCSEEILFLALRLYLCRQYSLFEKLVKDDSTIFDEQLSLISKILTRILSPKKQDLTICIIIAKNWSVPVPKILTNGSIENVEMIGWVIYQEITKLKHSCFPSISFAFWKGTNTLNTFYTKDKTSFLTQNLFSKNQKCQYCETVSWKCTCCTFGSIITSEFESCPTACSNCSHIITDEEWKSIMKMKSEADALYDQTRPCEPDFFERSKNLQSCLDLYNSCYKSNHPNIRQLLQDLIDNFAILRDYRTSAKYAKRKLELAKELYGQYSREYMHDMDTLIREEMEA